MNIRHEIPDPAFAYLVQAPLLLHVDAETSVELRGWCPDGFRAGGDWAPGEISGTLTIPFQGVFISFDVTLSAPDETGFVRFIRLTAREHGVLTLFHEAILGGQMSSVEGIIRSLDQPVDLVPMVRTEQDADLPGKKAVPRFARALGAAAFYCVAAFLLWTWLWSTAWEKVNTIPLAAGQIESIDPDGATAMASGWVQENHATRIFLGMDGLVKVNLGGEVHTLPATVTDIRASRGPTPAHAAGYLLHLSADAGALPAGALRTSNLARPGGAAALSVAAPLFGGPSADDEAMPDKVTPASAGGFRFDWPEEIVGTRADGS